MQLHRYLYHVSNPKFRGAIALEGLVPQSKSEAWLSDTPIEGEALFVTNSEDPKLYDSTYDDDIYRIDTKVLESIKWQPDPNFGTDQDVYLYTVQSIPLTAIEIIYKGTGKSSW